MPDIVVNPDPFSLVYNGLWGMIERNQSLRELIQPGNRIKFDEVNSQRASLAAADVTELALVTLGASFTGKENKDIIGLSKTFTWQISTGDFRLNANYHRVSWELFRSMVDWDCVLCSLEWCGRRFVNNCRFTEAQEGLLFEDLNRSIPGWSALWNVEVEFTFCKSLIRIENNGMSNS